MHTALVVITTTKCLRTNANKKGTSVVPFLLGLLNFNDLSRFYFCLATAFTFKHRYQLAFFNVKLLVGFNFPFMKTAFTKRFTFVFFKRRWSFKWQNICHCLTAFLKSTFINPKPTRNTFALAFCWENLMRKLFA